jgi:hypothetical protein
MGVKEIGAAKFLFTFTVTRIDSQQDNKQFPREFVYFLISVQKYILKHLSKWINWVFSVKSIQHPREILGGDDKRHGIAAEN